MDNPIAAALQCMFEKHRIVFWYDQKRELRDEYLSLHLDDIEKIELDNNEYGVKHRILRQEPAQRFLLYRCGPAPEDLDNWLLDVQLAEGVFRTDRVAIWLNELGLDGSFEELVSGHAAFFSDDGRRLALKALINGQDTPGQIRLKMLAVCAQSEPRLDAVLEKLLEGHALEEEARIVLITESGLDVFFWEQVQRHYGYQSSIPGVYDFALELFKSCYAMMVEGSSRLNTEALVFMKRWKDNRLHSVVFEMLSGACAEDLNVEADLNTRKMADLADIDYYDLVDLRITRELIQALADRSIPPGEVSDVIRKRRSGYWFKDYQDLYEALDYAAAFFRALGEARLAVESLDDGIFKYSRHWFTIDQHYRKYIYHMGRSSQQGLMSDLNEQIENHYVNSYLLNINNLWQAMVDAAPCWAFSQTDEQRMIFHQKVKPFLDKGNKVCVIISDGLRYEAGEELARRIRKEDRFEARLEAAVTGLPSYTQLGMAALLPHQRLELMADDIASVMVDGRSSQGTSNRLKALRANLPQRVTACKVPDLLPMSKEESRALFRDHDLVYIYHNQIDTIGDKLGSETQAFNAVEDTMQTLMQVIKKLTSANATNLIITADHGFIYQNRPIEESDFAPDSPAGKEITYKDRRFVLGRGLKAAESLRKFTSAELGLDGDLEVQIPKSIQRLRHQGSGSRYVHGGAALQEVVIPVIHVNKKRQSDVSRVDVEIMRGASAVISAGQLAVTLYQEQPVSDKVQPRTLRAGLYMQSGQLISDRHTVAFNFKTNQARDREVTLRFILTRDAEAANNQQVELRLEELVEGTSHFKEYKTLLYTLRRSFTSDFD